MMAVASLGLDLALGIFTFVMAVVSASTLPTGDVKYPVIFVPGDGGSQLQVKLNRTTAPHFFCTKHTDDYESLWLNIEEVLPGVIDCFVDNMRLVYNRTTRKTRSPDGVFIRVPGFGYTASVEWLDPSYESHFSSAIAYFHPLVKALVELGFQRGLSLRGAPFDFRKAPNELGDYYANLKTLIEETYKLNNNSKVVAVAHSLGNPTFLYFLNQQPQSWKDQYIQAFITLAGVWGGAVKPLRLFASGDSLGVYVVPPLTVRKEQRSMPSTAFLMPSDKFWKPSDVLVVTDKKNYTVYDYKEFFSDINFMVGYMMRQDTKDLIYDLKAPGVPIHCMHGIDVKTPAAIKFKKGEFPDTYPETIHGNGDGTVNIQSLLGCLKWQAEQLQPVTHHPLPGVDHMSVLSSSTVINYVIQVATGKR